MHTFCPKGMGFTSVEAIPEPFHSGVEDSRAAGRPRKLTRLRRAHIYVDKNENYVPFDEAVDVRY